MGARGPLPQPDNVRQLRGNPGKRPSKHLVARPGEPVMPTWLDREGQAEWKRVVPDLANMGVLAKVDRGILATYCDAWSKLLRARRELGTQALVVDGAKGEVRNPRFLVWRDAALLVETLAKQVFVTPPARLRAVRPEGASGVVDDEGEGILD